MMEYGMPLIRQQNDKVIAVNGISDAKSSTIHISDIPQSGDIQKLNP